MGDTVTLECFIITDDGDGVNITWTSPSGEEIIDFDSTYTSDNDTMTNITIADVDLSDSGNYTCFAENSFGSDSIQILLNITGKKIMVSFTCQFTHPHSHTHTHTLSFTLTDTNSPSSLTIYLSLIHLPIHHTPIHSLILLFLVSHSTRSQCDGDFVCRSSAIRRQYNATVYYYITDHTHCAVDHYCCR